MQTDFELIEEAIYPYANDDLWDSIEMGYLEGVDQAIQDGADVNCQKDGMNPLPTAVLNNDIKLATLLLKHGADPNIGLPLLTAVQKNNLQLVTLFVEHGADVNQGNPLLIAVQNNRIDLATVLVEHSADVNQGNPLFIAVLNNNIKLATLLVEHGADVNQGNPLLRAIQKDNIEIVKLLLENGANPHIRDNDSKRSILMQAIDSSISNSTKIVKLLLEYGAKPYGWDKERWTPLQIAVKKIELVIVQLLLEHGVDPKVKGYSGYTAISYAQQRRHINEKMSKIINYLENHKKVN